MKLIRKHQEVLEIVLQKADLSSSGVLAALTERGSNVSLVTVKRMLSEMVRNGILEVKGRGRSVRYGVTIAGRIFAEVDAIAYCAIEPDKRHGANGYNFDLFNKFPTEIFSTSELILLEKATEDYRTRIRDITSVLEKKEMERLVIELSWKSSRIEGNTYTLLDTEKLILEHKEAPGHDKQEARMILNHKNAFDFIRANRQEFKTLTRKNIEDLHAILVKDLGVGLGLRKGLVGVTGSKYRPLDNVYQIGEAVESLSDAISNLASPYAKALMALVGISYIQPFEDGNKRTSRLMANAILLAYGCAPLSYRSVDENEYRAAAIAFYELNTIVPMKEIFIAQYVFGAKNYAVKD